MQKGTKQTEEARQAISARMRKYWKGIPLEKRTARAKRGVRNRAKA